MTQPGRASIEIVGDVSKLGRQLQRDAQRAVDNIDLDTSNLTDEIGQGFEDAAASAADAFDDIDEHFRRTTQQMRADSDNFARALELDARQIADAIGVSVQTAQRWISGLSVPIERNRRALVALGATLSDVVDEGGDGFREFGRRVRDAGEEVEGFSRSARRGLGNIADTLTTLASTAAGFVITGINPATLVTITLWAAALAAAIPVVIGLAAALVDLGGVLTVLPGAIGALASSLIVGIVAFQGFGDAISAVIEGDPEKIAEAMERLAPAARRVVREFEELLPLFRAVGDSIQQEFFEPLVGIVEQFGERTLPRLRGELDTLAQAMGRALGNLGDLLTDAGNISILERLLTSTASITDRLGAAVADLGQAFLNALDAGLPSLERLADGLGGLIERFAGFINEAIESGDFQRFFEEALDTLRELGELVGAIGELFTVLFAGTDEAGRGFISTLTDLTQRLTEFFKSAEGQEALQDFSEIIGAVGVILGFVINATREFIDIFTELDDAVESVIFFFQDLGTTISDAWTGLVDTVSGAVDVVVGFFTALPGRILAFIQSIPGAVAAFFQAMFDQTLNIIAFGIAAVIVFFTDLPGQLAGALAALVEFVTTAFIDLRDRALEIIGNVVTFFQELPGRIGEFLASLPGIIANWFNQARDAATSRINSLVEFVKGVPGRILSALGNVGTLLFNAGKNIIQGLINGIGDKIGALRDKVVNAVSTIRDHLPFSPAKVGPLSGAGSPDIAGAKIAEMIAAGLESGLPLIAGAASRSAGAVADAGLTPLATATPGAPAPTLSPVQVAVEQQPVILVMIGDEQIDAHIERVVQQQMQIEVRRLMAGTRGA